MIAILDLHDSNLPATFKFSRQTKALFNSKGLA